MHISRFHRLLFSHDGFDALAGTNPAARQDRSYRTPVPAVLAALSMVAAGCSSQTDAQSDPGTQPGAALPAPAVPADAPVLAEVYSTLSGGALRRARLVALPPGVILQAKGMAVSAQDLEAELAQMPTQMREQMQQNAFFLLEQQVTQDLLVALARERLDTTTLDDERLLQRYFEDMTRSALVTDAEIEAFYNENSEMMGGAALAQIKPRIRQHLVQEKQQQIVQGHIRDLGDAITIALSAAWVEIQAGRMLDNPLDRARASGRPTMASFGADSCKPCQMMKPIREAIREKYDGRLNVIYVHADRDQVLASRYGIRGIPHMIFFDAKGSEIHQQAGMMTEEQIEGRLSQIGIEL